MKIKTTALRNNLYNLLDQVLETGEEIEIERKGRTLIIMEKKRKDIYQIFDERNPSLLNDSPSEYDNLPLNALDENWENDWDKKWDEWLNEK